MSDTTTREAHVEQALGEAIRRVRSQRGMTLEELGRESNLSPAMISKVERGMGDPSLKSLRQISEALGVPVAYFFAQEAAPEPDPVAVNHKRIYTYEKATYTVVASQIASRSTLLLLEAQPGAERGSEAIPHRPHEGFEQAIVIEGELEVTVGGVTQILGPLETISFPSTLRHSWTNHGSSVCRAVWSITYAEDSVAANKV